MHITATHIAYFALCQRKLWLFHHQIALEHTSDTVYEGKLIGENSYIQRAEKYIETQLTTEWNGVILSAKIDYYDAKARIIHEVKKSAKLEQAHIAQVRFYQFVLEQTGIKEVGGIIEYPKIRETHHLTLLNDADREQIEQSIHAIQEILNHENCPKAIKKSYCKTCSYFDFCYVSETV